MNQKIFHLPDGPEQQARDQSMRQAMEASFREEQGESGDVDLTGNFNVWADKSKNRRQFSYDAEAEAERWWMDHGKWSIGYLVKL